MIQVEGQLVPADFTGPLKEFWRLSASKIRLIQRAYDSRLGSPVFTVRGQYTSRGWTEWTQGFEIGSAILQFDATDDVSFLKQARADTRRKMTPHLTHFGVHDHGFNNVSTYGALLRLSHEKRHTAEPWEADFYRLALKGSAAVQARRWTALPSGGFIHSFNGPHSLFADTIRSLRSLAIGHLLGHVALGENDQPFSLLGRLLQHAQTTALFAVYYGAGRDAYDVRGRVAHESIFNTHDGSYRCPNSQQGYSPFSTWTRGLAWILCGFAEQLEFLASLPDKDLPTHGGRRRIEACMRKAATAAADFYIRNSPTDGIPYWDTSAPELHKLGDYLNKPAEPWNEFEPVDSSAAAIAAQGLLRLGSYEKARGKHGSGKRYFQAGLRVLRRLLSDDYLSRDPKHQGLLLHSVYHRPRGWDYVPPGKKVPCGESSMWGDYHVRELALYVQRLALGGPYYNFFNIGKDGS